jgi:hypothetical protein
VQGAIARGMMVRRERLGSARVPSTELPNLSTISAPEGSRSRRAVPSRYETEWPSVSVRPTAASRRRLKIFQIAVAPGAPWPLSGDSRA